MAALRRMTAPLVVALLPTASRAVCAVPLLQAAQLWHAGGLRWLSSEKVVKTHSTYCDGLMPFCDALAAMADIARIVPGRLSSARGSVEHFELVVKTATDKGWKCTARRGTQVQEVFIITDMTQEELQRAIEGTHAVLEKKTTWRTREAQRQAGQTMKSNA